MVEQGVRRGGPDIALDVWVTKAQEAIRSRCESYLVRLHNHPPENELQHAVEATPDRVSVHSLHRIQWITIDLRTFSDSSCLQLKPCLSVPLL